MIVLTKPPSRWEAARHLSSHCDELSNRIRNFVGVFGMVSAFLAAAVTLRPELFSGCMAELLVMCAVSGIGTLLVESRREMTARLQFLPPPFGSSPLIWVRNRRPVLKHLMNSVSGMPIAVSPKFWGRNLQIIDIMR